MCSRFLRNGFVAVKHGRRGSPKRRCFWLEEDSLGHLRLMWAEDEAEKQRVVRRKTTSPTRRSSRGGAEKRSIDFSIVSEIRKGLTTKRLKKQTSMDVEANCVSLVQAGAADRDSLDLQFQSMADRDTFVLASMITILDHAAKNGTASTGIEYVNSASDMLKIGSIRTARERVSCDVADLQTSNELSRSEQ